MINGARQTPPRRPIASRWVGILVVMVLAATVGAVAVLLSLAAGNNTPSAILTGGGAFAGAVGVLLAVVHYVREVREAGNGRG